MSTSIKKKDNKEKRGFTLIELLAVIVVLGVVASITIVIFTGTKDSSKKQISKASRENVLSSAKDYANEYLGDKDLWVPAESETLEDGTTLDRSLYCITVKNLIDKGFLKGDIISKNGFSGEEIVIVYRDSNGRVTTNYAGSEDECKGQIPDISIDILSNTNSNGNYDELVKFRLNLTDIGDYNKFYYTINDGNIMECDSSKRTCEGTVKGVYGKATIRGFVSRGSTIREVSKEVNIESVEADIEFVASGKKGNDDWYVSDVDVSVKVKNLDSGLYTLNGLCASTNGEKCNSFSGNSVKVKEINSGKSVCAKVTTLGGRETVKCTSYKVDTSVPTVTLSGDFNESMGMIDVYGTFAKDTSGLTVMGIYDSDINYDACVNPKRDYFKDVTGTSNVLIDSYSNNRDKSIWVKDKAGNCGKLISYYVHMNKSGWTSTKTERPLTMTIFPNYRIKKLIFAKEGYFG